MNQPTPTHKAIIWVQAEVQPLMATGEFSGRKTFEIKRFPMTITGMDENDTIKRVNETIAELKVKCQAQN